MKKMPVWMLRLAGCMFLALVMIGCSVGGGDKIEPAWARVEIDGIVSAGPYYIIKGPGYNIERVEGYDSLGNHDDTPGPATEYNLIFEAVPDDAPSLKNYFDAYIAEPAGAGTKNGSLIVLKQNGSEALRWNFREFIPAGPSASGGSGRTRFTLKNSRPADLAPAWDTSGGDDPFGNSSSYNPATDKIVEIDGIATVHFQFEENRQDRTVTLTYVLEEGNGIWTWVRNIVRGVEDYRNMGLVRTNAEGVEISRRNFTGCFPIRFEQCAGFDLDTKVKARVVLSYNRTQEG